MIKILLVGLLAIAQITAAYAGKKEINECQLSDLQITTFQLLDGSEEVELAVPADATDCLGAYYGNNSEFISPVDNLGYDEDGWLNKDSYNDWWTGPGAFVDQSDLYDLDGDGLADDPGWVYVGKDEGNGFKGQTSSDGSTSYDFIDNLITFTDCEDKKGNSTDCVGGNAVKGSWSYTPPAMNPDELVELLGGEFFDQVAIIFKAGSSFAMYNFSIEALGLDPVLAGDYNYAFTGTWDISEVLGGSALSNFSFWARDPVAESVQVPEPPTWILMMAVFAFMVRRKLYS
nr:PEP-CTERM sorting domain-containing protein [Thalassotalea sp. G2M2-11]